MPQEHYLARCYEVRNSLPANEGLMQKGLSPFEFNVVSFDHVGKLHPRRL